MTQVTNKEIGCEIAAPARPYLFAAECQQVGVFGDHGLGQTGFSEEG